MFPDFDEEEDLADLASWNLPGYSRNMAATKGSKGKSAAGNTAKRTTTKTKRSTAKKT